MGHNNIAVLLLWSIAACNADWLVWQQCYDGDNMVNFQTYPVLMYMNGNCVPDISSDKNTYLKINQSSPGYWSEWSCFDLNCNYCLLKGHQWNKLSNDTYKKMPCKDRAEKKYWIYLDQNKFPDHNDYSEPIEPKINHWHLQVNYPLGTTVCDWNTAPIVHAHPPGHSIIIKEELNTWCEAATCFDYNSIETFISRGNTTPCPMRPFRPHHKFMEPNMCIVHSDSVTLEQCTGTGPNK